MNVIAAKDSADFQTDGAVLIKASILQIRSLLSKLV